MEAFRFGFDFSIQQKATTIWSGKLKRKEGPRIRFPFPKRIRRRAPLQLPPPKKVPEVSRQPSTFSLRQSNNIYTMLVFDSTN